MRWSYGPLGVKDFFTLINLLGGAAGIYFVLAGRIELAGLALVAGYVCGDTLDGVVARLTHTSNKFGSAFDSITDHLTQAIVPGLIVLAAYREANHPLLGFTLMAMLIACGTIRHALFSVATLNDPLMYCGLPRTVSGFAAIALVLSHFFARGASPLGIASGVVLIPVLALAGLLPVPYMTHRGARRMQTYVKVVVVGIFLTPAIALVAVRELFFDVVFFWMMLYAVAGWVPLLPAERRAFFDRYRRWTAEVSR